MKNTQIIKNTLTTLIVTFALSSAPSHAMVFNFLNGSDLYATLTTSGSTNFDLHFVGTNVAPGGFINELFLDGPNGTFTNTSTQTTATGIYSLNNYNGGGGAGKIYDWKINFPQANNPNRLTIGEHGLWSIVTTDPNAWSISKIHINAYDSQGNSIKINGCQAGTQGCGSVTVSEPAALSLLGLGLLGLGVIRRKKA